MPYLHPQLLQATEDSFLRQRREERLAPAGDLYWLHQDEWLKDSAVQESLRKRRGLWEIHLVFIHHRQPLRLIARFIKAMPDQKRAAFTAQMLRRQAAKDARGTLQTNAETFRPGLN